MVAPRLAMILIEEDDMPRPLAFDERDLAIIDSFEED